MAISITSKFAPLKAKLEQVNAESDNFFSRLERRLSGVDNIQAKQKEINARVVARLVPAFRSALLSAYRSSGLKVDSGRLQNAVMNAAIIPVERGILIQIIDEGVSKQAAALQFGAIHGERVTKGYDFFNLNAFDIEPIYLRYYQEEIDKEMKVQ